MVIALGIGSNLGNRLGNLIKALSLLQREGVRLIRASDVFETEPWGVTDQPRFLNACVLADSQLPPEELLQTVKRVEQLLGRVKNRRWGERTIDVDILLCDDVQYRSPTLTIPHIDLHRRDFVLIPLAQILPNWRHPLLHQTVRIMAAQYQQPPRICSLRCY